MRVSLKYRTNHKNHQEVIDIDDDSTYKEVEDLFFGKFGIEYNEDSCEYEILE